MDHQNVSNVLKLADAQAEVDLDAILSAWHTATERLKQTHEILSTEVRRLTDELEVKNRELARKNRLADLGQMASHVAHEVRNNLVPMTLYLSLLRRRLSADSGALDVMDKIDLGFTALESTVHDLLQFAADRDPLCSQFRLRELIDEVCDTLSPQSAAQKVQLEIDVPAPIVIDADRDLLRRAILNLVLNALDAMTDGGELSITCHNSPHAVELEVADTGPGVPANVRDRLFEPFFTTKSGGTGLGLTIAYQVAEVHGGDINVLNCPQGGTAFTIRIPRRVMEKAA